MTTVPAFSHCTASLPRWITGTRYDYDIYMMRLEWRYEWIMCCTCALSGLRMMLRMSPLVYSLHLSFSPLRSVHFSWHCLVSSRVLPLSRVVCHVEQPLYDVVLDTTDSTPESTLQEALAFLAGHPVGHAAIEHAARASATLLQHAEQTKEFQKHVAATHGAAVASSSTSTSSPSNADVLLKSKL